MSNWIRHAIEDCIESSFGNLGMWAIHDSKRLTMTVIGWVKSQAAQCGAPVPEDLDIAIELLSVVVERTRLT